MMKNLSYLAFLILSAFGFSVFIWLFIALYAAIELQSASIEVTNKDTRTAVLQVIGSIKNIKETRKKMDLKKIIEYKYNNKFIDIMKSRNNIRVLAANTMVENGISDAFKICKGGIEDRKLCQIDRDRIACEKDWEKISECYARALQISHATADNASVDKLKKLLEVANNEGYSFNHLSVQLKDIKQSISLTNVPKNSAIFVVSESISSVKIPLFLSIYQMPRGTVIALFTALMGCAGAMLSLLINYTLNIFDGEGVAQHWKSILMTPLMGAVVGFLVYFVIAAGTSFLVQPAPSGPGTGSVANLSAPSLASLGILAGLASRRTALWLQAKANSIFDT